MSQKKKLPHHPIILIPGLETFYVFYSGLNFYSHINVHLNFMYIFTLQKY